MTALLTRYFHTFCSPGHIRDQRFFEKYLPYLQLSLLISLLSLMGSILARVFEPKPVLWIIFLSLFITSAGLGGILLKMLKIEFESRNFYRKKRLALPHLLADGLNALERKDYKKTALAIFQRQTVEMDPELTHAFDILIFDLLETHPDAKDCLIKASEDI